MFDHAVFGIGGAIVFANDTVANLAASGLNTIVLRSFDNDANPATPFGAGTAADLIAAQVTSPGPGFFIYFNGLDMPRLVYSTDLNDSTADLKILARMTNLTGQPGRDALARFSSSNFQVLTVPEPASNLIYFSRLAHSLSLATPSDAGAHVADRVRLSSSRFLRDSRGNPRLGARAGALTSEQGKPRRCVSASPARPFGTRTRADFLRHPPVPGVNVLPPRRWRTS